MSFHRRSDLHNACFHCLRGDHAEDSAPQPSNFLACRSIPKIGRQQRWDHSQRCDVMSL